MPLLPGRLLALMAIVVGLMMAGPALAANNVLDNSSLEDTTGLPATSWTVYGISWANYALLTDPATAQDGNNSFKVYGQFTGGDNYSGIYQSVASGPGSSYQADCWMFSPASDHITGGNQGWLEVTFRNESDDILALYRSAIIDTSSPQDQWIQLAVTNQYDPSTYTVTNTVTSLDAPAGTAVARIQVVFYQTSDNAGGALWWDNFTLDQTAGAAPPSISALTPNATALFNDPTAGLSFTASSDSATIDASGIQVMVNGLDVSGQLQITGTDTEKNVLYDGLVADRIYTASIRVQDQNGFVNTATTDFDTFAPGNFVWEAEDYDFELGQFIDNPVPGTNSADNRYYGRTGYEAVDFHDVGDNGDKTYRPSDAMATAICPDVVRQKFIDAGNVPDFNVGWFDAGEWVNYTRTYPAGTYNIYARLAGGAGAATVTLAEIPTGGAVTNTLGTFSFNGNNWNAYVWVPLRDSFGNLAKVTLSGETTLRATTGGGANMNFFMLAPPSTEKPEITGLYPSGGRPFEPTNTLAFAAASASAPINDDGIQVTLDGVDVSSQLVLGGSGNARTATLPGLKLDHLYQASITVTDTGGGTVSRTVDFDTFSESYLMIEAEDFDFNGGQFIDDPAPSSYAIAGGYFLYPNGDAMNAAVFGVDLTTPDSDDGEQFAYRPFESCGTEVCQDFLRTKYTDMQSVDPTIADYNVGWWNGGTWLNYTRTIPTNTYQIYGRLAGGGAFSGTTMSLVTGGQGTTNQTTQLLGSFSNPDADGWQSWHWVPLVNGDGDPVVVSLGGTNTLKVTSGSGLNANFYLFVPAPLSFKVTAELSGSDIVISFPTQSGTTYQVLYKDDLNDATWQLLKEVQGDGTTQPVSDPISGNRFYRVAIP